MAGLSSPHYAEFFSDRRDGYDTLLAKIIRQDDVDAFREYVVRYPDRLYKYGAVQYCELISDPFEYAAEHGSANILRLLLSDYHEESLDRRYKSDGEYLLREGNSLLNIACRRAHLETVKLLLETSENAAKEACSPDRWRWTPLLCAAGAIADGYDAERGRRDVHTARCGEIMRLLLDGGARATDVHEFWEYQVNERGEPLSQSPTDEIYLEPTVLSLAIRRARADLVQRLIDGGADVHAKTYYTRESLLNPHLACSPSNVTPLHIGSRFLNAEGIQVLLRNRGDVSVEDMMSIPDSLGRLPLHWAMLNLDSHNRELNLALPEDQVVTQATATIRALLDNSSPEIVNAQDLEGRTALHYALSFVDGEALDEVSRRLRDILGRLLCKKGADAALRSKQGTTALHCLAHRVSGASDLQLMALLLEHGASVHDTDADGNTPLHFGAGFRPRIDAVRFLIQQGAAADARNRAGLTPLDSAANMYLPSLEEIKDFEKAQDEVMQTLVDAVGGPSLMDRPSAGGKTPREARDECRAKCKELLTPKPLRWGRGGH